MKRIVFVLLVAMAFVLPVTAVLNWSADWTPINASHGIPNSTLSPSMAVLPNGVIALITAGNHVYGTWYEYEGDLS